MTASNITNFPGSSDLIEISDRLGMLANKAHALNLAIRGLEAEKHDVTALDYLSQELAHEIEAFADEIHGDRPRSRKAKGGA